MRMRELECRSCGKPIVFAITEAGNRVPLNALPQRMFVVEERAGVEVARSVFAFSTHFQDCPESKEWRKPR